MKIKFYTKKTEVEADSQQSAIEPYLIDNIKAYIEAENNS